MPPEPFGKKLSDVHVYTHVPLVGPPPRDMVASNFVCMCFLGPVWSPMSVLLFEGVWSMEQVVLPNLDFILVAMSPFLVWLGFL